MTTQPRSRLLALTVASFVLACGWIALGESNRPRLVTATRQDRLAHVRQAIAQNGEGAIPSIREYFLDYPDAPETDLRIRLATLLAARPSSDGEAATELENAARYVLDLVPPGSRPTQAAFERAGFSFVASYGWPASFVVADIDGDGRDDVVFAAPGEPRSMCFLFRHTVKGWQASTFAVGLNILGLQVFGIAPGGPKAIVMSTLLTDEYDGETRTDVFSWSGGPHGGLRCVLAGATGKGWQWDHADAGRRGVQDIWLYRGSRYGEAAQLDRTFRWNGTAYMPLDGKPIAPPPDVPVSGTLPDTAHRESGYGDRSAELARIERDLFKNRRYEESLGALRDFAASVRGDRRDPKSKNDLLREECYHEAICLRKLGRTRAAELLLRELWSASPDNAWGTLAGEWLGIEHLPES